MISGRSLMVGLCFTYCDYVVEHSAFQAERIESAPQQMRGELIIPKAKFVSSTMPVIPFFPRFFFLFWLLLLTTFQSAEVAPKLLPEYFPPLSEFAKQGEPKASTWTPSV